MRGIDRAVYRFKSKDIAWVSPGQGVLTFDNWIEPRGPNGGRMVIHAIELHATLSLTVATATLQGEDCARAFRTITVEQIDRVRRYNEITGDAARLISFAHYGPDGTHEHADFAAGGPTTVKFSLALPIAKPFAYDPYETGLAAELLAKVAIGQAQSADMSLGSSAVTVNSGTYWVIAECHEEMAVVQHAVDEWVQQDFDTTTTGKLRTDGRLHDLYLFVRGANGGATLANLTEAWVEHVMPQSLLKDPDLKQFYQRYRGGCTNLFSTKGNPLRTDPFTAADAGTLRAVALLLTTGNKIWEPAEREQVLVKTVQASSPGTITMLARIARRTNPQIAKGLESRYGGGGWQAKTRDKTKRNEGDWRPDHWAYLPKKLARG